MDLFWMCIGLIFTMITKWHKSVHLDEFTALEQQLQLPEFVQSSTAQLERRENVQSQTAQLETAELRPLPAVLAATTFTNHVEIMNRCCTYRNDSILLVLHKIYVSDSTLIADTYCAQFFRKAK